MTMTNGRKNLVDLCGGSWQVKELLPQTISQRYGDPNESLEGYVDFQREIIYIDKTLNNHRKHLALVHEMLHIVYERSAYELPDEEQGIAAIQHGVLEIVLNYPWRDRDED
jgi:hypothetical protein